MGERAAWAYVSSLGNCSTRELIVINFGLVFEPLLSADWGTSGELVKKLIDRDMPGVSDVNFAIVDVRNVAAAHVSAMTSPDAAGQRFLCAEGNHSMRDAARILQEHLGPLGYTIPTRKVPAIALRVVAPWDKTARLALNDFDQRQQLDSTKTPWC